MDFGKLALLVKKYIEASKQTDTKPGISYIIERSLKINALRTLLSRELKTTNNLIKLFYTVFFLFEGDSLEVAQFKAENDLYYIIIQEVGDKEYKDEECEECDGHGTVECYNCDDGNEECYNCDGTGEVEYGDGETHECEDCNGTGEVSCSTCDGEGNLECHSCDGAGDVSSENEFVYLNNEYWIYYGEDTREKIDNAVKESTNDLIDIYDILDNTKGGLFLLKTESESEEIELDDFENEFGSYYDAQGKYLVHSEFNVNQFNLTNSFRIRQMGNSWTIR